MRPTRVVMPDTNRTIQLPQKFFDLLGIRAGEELTVQLVEEAGLILVFPARRNRSTELGASTPRQQVQLALANAGMLATLDPATVKRYAPPKRPERLSPLKIGGKPVSEIIVEERSRW